MGTIFPNLKGPEGLPVNYSPKQNRSIKMLNPLVHRLASSNARRFQTKTLMASTSCQDTRLTSRGDPV